MRHGQLLRKTASGKIKINDYRAGVQIVAKMSPLKAAVINIEIRKYCLNVRNELITRSEAVLRT